MSFALITAKPLYSDRRRRLVLTQMDSGELDFDSDRGSHGDFQFFPASDSSSPESLP